MTNQTDPWLVGANVDAADFNPPGSREEVIERASEDLFRSTRRGDPLHDLRTGGDRRHEFINSLTEDDFRSAIDKIQDPAVKKAQQEKLKDHIADEAAEEFVRRNPSYLAVEENYQLMTEYLEENNLPMTVENLEAAYADLLAAGALEVEKGQVKELTEGELLQVSRLAQAGRITDAIGKYLSASLPDFSDEEVLGIIHDPDYRELCDEAVLYTFIQNSVDAHDTDEFREFVARFAGTKPLNFPLVKAAWEAFTKQQAQPEPEPEPVFNPDDLSADEAEEALKLVTRERARQLGVH